ncbi:MAG: TerB family tellurite resistance protein [Pseudanabaenaceae cyanobacterium]
MSELPPPISPRQMDMLRAVTAMAWADGQLEPDEIKLMLAEFARLFAKSPEQEESLKSQLEEYLGQNIPLEEIVPRIRPNDRPIVAQLAYQVIAVSRRQPNEPAINLEEAAAWQRLVRLLQLSEEETGEIIGSGMNVSHDPHTLASKIHEILLKQT